MELRLTITATTGAGDNFPARVIEAVENGDNVYIQIGGEYGHLIVETVEDWEEV